MMPHSLADALKPLRALGLLVVILMLSACGGEQQSELRAWIAQQKTKTPTSVPPLTKPQTFEPAPYALGDQLDPYDIQKLKSALAKARAALGANALQPDLKRRREALEAFPLDSIKMIGFVYKNGKPTALMNAQGGLYQTTVGQYVGSDFGKVTALNEREMVLKELIQDGTGEWTERITKLPLLEATKDAGAKK